MHDGSAAPKYGWGSLGLVGTDMGGTGRTLTFLDTAVVLQNIVATPAATVITRCLYVKPFVVVLEVRRFRRHRRSFRLRFLRRPPL